MTDDVRKIVIVLGPGRSGTSLLMQILNKMGMHISDNMLQGSVGNPEGFFEDLEIVKIHKNVLQELNTQSSLPMPEGWLESEVVKKSRPELRNLLEKRLAEFNGIWGFKDPRTSNLLPLWNRILNSPGTIPVFIIAMRNPASVSSSLNRQINKEKAIAEMQWLQRTTDALHHTAADCFIVHYEDWFDDSSKIAEELLVYTGLDQYFSGELDEVLREIIKPNLNRAVYDEYQVQNEYVYKLYDILRNCRGDNFDREQLMATVKECRKVMNGFKGWGLEAQKYMDNQTRKDEQLKKEREQLKSLSDNETALKKKLIQNEEQLKKERERVQELKVRINDEQKRSEKLVKMESDLHEVVRQNNEYLKQLKDVSDNETELRSKLIQNDEQLKKEREQLKSLSDNETALKKKLIQNEEQLKKERLRVKELNVRINDQKRRLETIDKFLRHLNSCLNQLEKKYHVIKRSLRWKMGNTVFRSLEMLAFRFNRPKIMDQLEKNLQELKNLLATQNPGEKELAFLTKKMEQIKKNFNMILASKRWKMGDGIVSTGGLFFLKSGKKSKISEDLDKIFAEYENWKKNDPLLLNDKDNNQNQNAL
jgi:hypothetical protein